jgi:magnesium transporter
MGCNHQHYCARFGKQHLEWSLFNRLVKEVSLSLLNGVIWPLYYLWKSLSSRRQNGHWGIVTTALVSVIIIASLGTFVLVIG